LNPSAEKIRQRVSPRTRNCYGNPSNSWDKWDGESGIVFSFGTTFVEMISGLETELAIPGVDPLAETTEQDTDRRSLENPRPALPLYSILSATGEAEAGSGGDQPARE
jgi:hypothetical protein